MDKEEYDRLTIDRLVPRLLGLTKQLDDTRNRYGRLVDAEQAARKYLFNGEMEQTAAEHNYLESVKRTLEAEESLVRLTQEFLECSSAMGFLESLRHGWLATLDRREVYNTLLGAEKAVFLIRDFDGDPGSGEFISVPFWIAELRTEDVLERAEELEKSSGKSYPLLNPEEPFGEWSDAKTVACPNCGEKAVLIGMMTRYVPSHPGEKGRVSGMIHSFCTECLAFKEFARFLPHD